MKKYKMAFMINAMVVSVFAITFSACNQAEIDKAVQQRDSVQAVLDQRDSNLNELLVSFNDVEANLDSVTVKQHIITMNVERPGEQKASVKDHINEQIRGINDLMDQNRKTIADLKHKLKSSGNKNANLMKLIGTLNDQIVCKDEELKDLNAKLANANVYVAQLQTSVEELTQQNASNMEKIAEVTTALHTAYYIVGKSSDLVKAKLIDKKGGLLGIGRTSQLNSNFNNSNFTKIDYTQMLSIAINSKSVKIITSHPSDSYKMDMEGKDLVKNLSIINPEKFWSTSKYLVVLKN